MRRASRWRTVRLAGLVPGIVVLAVGCGKSGGHGGHGGPGGPGGPMVVQVVGVQSAQQPLEERIALVGSLAANEAVLIKSEIDGSVEEIGFDEGQRVEAGQVLIRIDQRTLEAALGEAEANLRLADATLQRYTGLAETRAISGQELDQARAAFEARKAAVAIARARLNDATVTAPFAGVMGTRLVSLGQFVSTGQQLSALIDQDPIKAEFQVPERFLSRVEEGQPITVIVAAYPAQRFRGAVYFVDPEVDAGTRTALVKARIPNPDGRLRRGMFANLELTLQVKAHAVVVPESAVMLQGEQASVFVAAEGTAQIRPVTTGIRLAGVVEIASGLAPGETVVIEGTQKLHPGAVVTVRYDERPMAEIGQAAAGHPAVLPGS